MIKNLTVKVDLTGVVVKGNSIGGKMGSPTINLAGQFDIEYGVYACTVYARGGRFLGAMHFGPRVTLGENEPVLEVRLLDFSGDLYGETVRVEVYNKIRDVKKFADLSKLKERIEKDIAFIRKHYDQISEE